MDLSIIILNYKTRGLLKNCLNGILRYPLNIKFEIIVVDNDSRDGSVEMVQQNFPQVKLIASPVNGGHAAGNNLGIKQAQGRYLLFINTDIVILDNSLEKMVNLMDQSPGVAASSCKLINPDGSRQMNCRRFPRFLVPIYSRTFVGKFGFARKAMAKYLMTNISENEAQPVDWLLTACLIVRKTAIEQVGFMDERYFLYFADVDWCRQFWQAGWLVYYFPQTELIHYLHRESAEDVGILSLLNKKTRIHIWDWFKYLSKHQFQIPTYPQEAASANLSSK